MSKILIILLSLLLFSCEVKIEAKQRCKYTVTWYHPSNNLYEKKYCVKTYMQYEGFVHLRLYNGKIVFLSGNIIVEEK